MRDIIERLNSAEQQLFAEVSVNTMFLYVVKEALAQVENDLLGLASNSDNFKSEYERLQHLRFLYKDLLILLDELATKFYKPYQKGEN